MVAKGKQMTFYIYSEFGDMFCNLRVLFLCFALLVWIFPDCNIRDYIWLDYATCLLSFKMSANSYFGLDYYVYFKFEFLFPYWTSEFMKLF